MASISTTTKINAPVEKVFAIFSDLANAPARVKAIKKLEILTPGPVGVGTRFRETRVMFGREATEEMTFTAFEPNKSYTVTAQSCGAFYQSVYQFEPDGAGTQVSMTFEGRPQTFAAKLMAPLGWLLTGTMKKCLQEDMNDLKAAAEKG